MWENLHYPRFWQGLGWLLVALVCWLSLTPQPPHPPGILGWDKLQHVAAYAGLAVYFRLSFRRHWRWPAFLLALGVALEFLQGQTGFRTFDLYDIAANAIGVLAGTLLAAIPFFPRIERVDGLVWRCVALR